MKKINELDQPAFELAITRCVEQQGRANLDLHLENKSELIEMFVFEDTEEKHAYWETVSITGTLPTYKSIPNKII